MKVLVIDGSPKGQRSNTLKLTQAFIDGLSDKREIVREDITIRDKNISTCLGCFGCWNKTPGVCVVKDDMKDVLDKILWADLVIWSFGLYYFNVPGKMKMLIDRLLPLSLPFMMSETESGGHPSRYDMSGKRHVVISTCGFYTAKGNYGSVNEMFGHFLGKDGYETIYCGQGELFRIQELHDRTDEYLSYVHKAGNEFAENRISRETKNKLDEPLMPREVFEAMADASWGISKENGKKEDETFIFTKQMAAMYNKSSYTGKDIVLEMYYTDKEKRFQIVLKKDGYEVRKDSFLKPDTKIITPFTVWKDIASGKITGVQAMMEKKYSVEGDFNTMLNWDKYFGHGDVKQESYTSNDKKSKGTSMMLTLIPWIAFWVAVSINSYIGAFITLGICALTEIIFFRFRKTIYDVISSAAVTGLSIAALLLPELLNIIIPCSYSGFGLMWSASCLTKIPLTSWYSMKSYNGEKAFENPLFMLTNRILTLAWGILYILTGVWTFFLMGTPASPYIAIINNIMPVIMGIFTAWFQKWYPAHYASK